VSIPSPRFNRASIAAIAICIALASLSPAAALHLAQDLFHRRVRNCPWIALKRRLWARCGRGHLHENGLRWFRSGLAPDIHVDDGGRTRGRGRI
jgi:hypothetical protein